jgi:hypothetical protein
VDTSSCTWIAGHANARPSSCGSVDGLGFREQQKPQGVHVRAAWRIHSRVVQSCHLHGECCGCCTVALLLMTNTCCDESAAAQASGTRLPRTQVSHSWVVWYDP